MLTEISDAYDQVMMHLRSKSELDREQLTVFIEDEIKTILASEKISLEKAKYLYSLLHLHLFHARSYYEGCGFLDYESVDFMKPLCIAANRYVDNLLGSFKTYKFERFTEDLRIIALSNAKELISLDKELASSRIELRYVSPTSLPARSIFGDADGKMQKVLNTLNRTCRLNDACIPTQTVVTNTFFTDVFWGSFVNQVKNSK